MDIEVVLTLMISFGTLVALIMSKKNEKNEKNTPHML